MEIQIGERVKAVYNSGVYIGEVIGFSERMPKAKVRVLAVLKHPDQGDLHHPWQANVAMFHVRKALAEREVALVFLRHLEPYEGSIPDYRESLEQAFHRQIGELQLEADHSEHGEWARLSLERLALLKQEYGIADHSEA